MNLEELLGKDLAGYELVQWIELQLPTDEMGGRRAGDEYYTNELLAKVVAKGAGWWGYDGHTAQVFVLVKHGTAEGIAVSGMRAGEVIKLANEQGRKLERANKALAKLDPEERQLLGYDEDVPDAEDGEASEG